MRAEAAHIPAMPTNVATVFCGYPAQVGTTLRAVRDLIYQVAEAEAAGPLTETLKWGEPAYLPQVTKSGTTIRLGLVHGQAAVLFHCQTTLVTEFREQFSGIFRFDGNRALVLDRERDVSTDALAICIARALTYQRKKRKDRT